MISFQKRYYETGAPTALPVGALFTWRNLKKMLNEYYRLHGWQQRWCARSTTLKRLGLDE